MNFHGEPVTVTCDGCNGWIKVTGDEEAIKKAVDAFNRQHHDCGDQWPVPMKGTGQQNIFHTRDSS